MPGDRPRDWIEDEQGWDGARAELKRLFRRARARPWWPLLLALFMTAGVVGVRARKQRSFGARTVLRVTEGDLDAATAPRPARQLRSYVLDVAFSNQRLLELIKRDHLYARELKRDPSFAIEAMRDDLEVEVWRNYFVEQRQADDAGRSARIAIEYRAKDPELAYRVTQELGRLVVEEEEASRVQQAADAVRTAELQVTRAREELVRIRGEIVTKELAARHTPPPQDAILRLAASHLQKSIEPLEQRLRELEALRNALALRAGLEKNQLGLRFEVVDPGRVPRLGISRPRELVMIGLLTLLLCLPLGCIAAGAFDGRIYDAEDVRRLGLSVIGHVDHFPGDDVGALQERLRRDARRDPR